MKAIVGLSAKPSMNTEMSRSIYYMTTTKGYEKWVSSDGVSVAVHQLIAICEGSKPAKVFSNGDYQCHHKNGVPWDNRPENIEFVSRKQHSEIHGGEIQKEVSKEELKKLRWDKGLSHGEIAKEINLNKSTVRKSIREYELGWDQKGPKA